MEPKYFAYEEFQKLCLFKNKEITNHITRNAHQQVKFRNRLIARDKTCVISNAHECECEAAHIVPYNEKKIFHISNGLLMSASLHKLFDQYLFSINEDDIIVCDINLNSNISIAPYVGNKVRIPEETKNYIKEHYRKYLEKKN